VGSIDPGREDPMEFIEFRRELAAPAPARRSRRGSEAIVALQLNRNDPR